MGDIPLCIIDALLASDTRIQAHEAIKPHKRLQESLILMWLEELRSATCDALEFYTKLSHQSCSARISELAKRGVIEDCGRAKTRTGRSAVLYRIAARN